MKKKRVFFLFIFQIIILLLLQNIPYIRSSLTCNPDYKSKGDNYFSVNDPQDTFEYFYGYEFAHKAGGEYYDHWKGVYWDSEKFCYDAYDNFTRPEKLSDLGDYEIEEFQVVNNIEDVTGEESYILIEHDQSNLINFHKKMCMTKTHNITNYNHGEYELLIKMDNLFEEKYLNTPHHFYFTIENPSNETITFSFKTRNFVNTTEEMNDTLIEMGPDPNQCLEEEVTDSPDNNNEPEQNDENPDDKSDKETENTEPTDSDITKENEDLNQPVKETTPPCEREIIVLNTTFLNWTEEYPIPELFYFTNNYTIEPHQSIIVNISLTFEKNRNTTEGGYFIISEETGKSPEPFYWPVVETKSGKIEKLVNMEIILESNFTVGLSSFSLMRRRAKEENSYLGELCNVKSGDNILNGKCGDGYYCDSNTNGKCKKNTKKECKNMHNSKCTECFLISTEGQWNPTNGPREGLTCDLDYIDITKVKINNLKKIEVPPAIHWRVTMDFWIWISDTNVLKEANVNLNIVYKDFIGFTLRCSTEGLNIYATPIEWLYEYPTYEEDTTQAKQNMNRYKYTTNIGNLLSTNNVGSLNEVALEDLVKDASSNWVYVRYAFNLDSSKHYLNDLPESNLKVPQIYSEQTGMPFHMKKFYGLKEMTYLYINHFFHPLTEAQERQKKKIVIYLRNLNIFREYMPQNIITKYYNLHLIDDPSKFPQLLASFPFSGLTLSGSNTYKMKGYNYFRKNTGEVLENQREEKDILLYLDTDVETLRPPRNFWRLNFLKLNEQPETCDLENFKSLICGADQTCFEDEKPFICEAGTETKPYYLDINNYKCNQFCEYGYMHSPRYSSKINQRLYCSHACDTNFKQCPSDELKYTDIHSNFHCSNNFFNLYYKCFDENEAITNADFSGIFFSYALKTPTIYIDLKNQYTQFAIDFWYFPDARLRNKRYTEFTIYDNSGYSPTSHVYPTSEQSRIIFLSDCCKVMYGSSSHYSSSIINFYVNNSPSSLSYSNYITPINDNNWNHFVLTYFLSIQKSFVYYLSFNYDQYNYHYTYSNPHQYWVAPSNVILSKIIFCNNDENAEPSGILSTQCKNAQWLDGFYRKLQIFDIKYSSRYPMFYAHQFEDGAGGMLRHRYIFGLNSVVDNHLIDLIQGANGRVSLLYDSNYIQNPDKANYILYESNFDPQGGISNWFSYQYVSGYSYKNPKLQIYRSNCDSHCQICQTSGVCLKCKDGYALFNRGCRGNANNNDKTATYFYKNPGKNMQDRLSLNLNFNHIKNSPYFTIFFFIKIYGFVENAGEDGAIKIIIFNQERNKNGELVDDFYLAWNPSGSENLFFSFNGQTIFSYNYFRENYFGFWIPISFTAFREDDRSFKMNMVQASILHDNLAISYNDEGNLFPYIKFSQFTITNKWIGLLCDIKVYNNFIVNAWGIIKSQYGTLGPNQEDISRSLIGEINLRSDSPESCLSSSQMQNQPSSGYKIECVADYNPYILKCSGGTQRVSYNQTGTCTGSSNYLGDFDSSYSYDEYSYENQSPIRKNYFPYYSGNKIYPRSISFIDFNRYTPAIIENIKSPQDVWAVDFWFRTSTNQAVKNIMDGHDYYSYRTINNNNFKEFIIEWNYHIKVRVYKEDSNEEDMQFTYYVECTPLVVSEHPDLGSKEKLNQNIRDAHYNWRYVTCGVNFPEKIYYMTFTNRMSEEHSFTTDLVLIPSSPTTLTITENSRTGYGFTFIYQLRLWHCYNCAQSFRNLEYKSGDKNFNSVLHNFVGTGTSSYNNQSISDQANSGVSTVMYQAANYPGYTLNFAVTDNPILCDESDYEYYNEDLNRCEIHFNVARSSGDKVIKIPSSRNGRYTMEFWFFVENSAELSPGMNFFWDLHMSITILRDTANKNTINAFCFPQSYKDSVDGLGGQDIITLYDKALNKDKYSFYQGSSKWLSVRCAVDQTRKIYYINDNLELDLEGELLYGTTRNYRPFRYFKIETEHYFKMQNARLNPTRIFIRNIKCYRDYIDFKFIDLKYKSCSSNWNDCQFYPLVFCMDYGANSSPSWRSYNGLYYYLYRESGENSINPSSGYWSGFLSGDTDPYYPTFPDIYMPNFCAHGQTGGDKEACSGSTYLCRLNSTAFFWPYNSESYIDLDTLKEEKNCNKGCRPPDGWVNKNVCIMEKGKNNLKDCGTNSTSASKDNYYKNYVCDTDYVKVYYECIDKKIVSNSAMYFSNVYSFPNVVFNPSIPNSNSTLDYGDWKTETRLASYYIEIWMKFDILNYQKLVTEKEHYLYAYPHEIFKDPLDQKFKYSNIIVSNYFYTLTSIQNYEWNKIIIENYFNRDTKKFTIRFYLNYEFDNPEVDLPDLESSLYKLHFRGFGFCTKKTDTYCRVDNNPAYLTWGVAWYRNFRVWDADITSLQSIQAFEYGYTEIMTALKYYFPLTIDYIERNTIKDKINSNNRMKLNYWVYYSGDDYVQAFDDDIRENYSTDNFDKTAIYENNYISGLNEDGTDYLISACASECKRCYSSSNTDCYECKLGYAIYGKTCKLRTGFFFKTPPKKEDIDEIKIRITNVNNNFDLEKVNPVTITLYIKFFGINLDKLDPTINYYIFVLLYQDSLEIEKKTFIGYNYNEKTIVFVVNGIERFSIKAKDYIGVWTLFGISIHRMNDKEYFPNMLNFMVDQQILIPKSDFNIQEEEVKINTFTIHTKAVCYYSSLRVFSSFYFGPYGHVNAISITRGSKLIYQINFYSASSNGCINDADLIDPEINTLILSPVCAADYQPYEDTNNICSDDYHFMDVIYKVTPPCELCDEQCITNCFSLESSACTCDYYEGLYWIKTDKGYKSYECQKIDSINFAFFNPVTITGLNIVKNDEMTISFWFDIYEYVDNNFDSLKIIWDKHLAVIIKGNGKIGDAKYLNIECHGDYDKDNPDMVHSIIEDNEELKLKFNRWNYIVCQADKFHKVMRLNNIYKEDYIPVTYSGNLRSSQLIINDTTINFNYGFSFVREIKLYNSSNFEIWDESRHNIKKQHFDYLLHHFHNTFNEEKISETKIIDQVERTTTKLTPKSGRIGYNYVIDYQYLTICEEGYVYNNLTNTCFIFDSQECSIPRNSEDKCLLCSSNKPFLKYDDNCYSDCGPYYFADNYFKQCRECHETCYTCSAKNYNNCLSCTGEYYYIESLHICVPNCQEYGLVISTDKENTCQELLTESYITVPVYLNFSYDYNPNNEDFISKIIDRDNFNIIEGHLGKVSTLVETKWIYNREATIELNKDYRYFDINDFPEGEYPFDISKESELKIEVKNDYFKYGYKYVFDLQIYSQNGFYSTYHIHKYILMMNDYPVVGPVNVLPSKGYLENIFLITINECTDDVSEKSLLQYKFTYFKKEEDVLTGHNETSDEEILIQDWSIISEVLFQFPEVSEEGKYYIRGYCKDELNLFYSEIQEVEIYEVYEFIKKKIPLEETIKSIDLDQELSSAQLLKRAEFLAKTSVDFEKGIEFINRTDITTYSNKGILQEKLILYKPTAYEKDLYCNERGDSYRVYFFLICDCKGADGNMCQIDHNSYNYMINVYKELYNKIRRMQTGKYNKDLIKALNLLMKSGATFMNIENMDFMLQSIEYINLYINKFKEKLIEGNNYELFFDIYNSLIEYGVSIVNKLKYQNFIATNSRNAKLLYDEKKFVYATLADGDGEIVQDYFNKVKISLQNLLEFYAKNKKEVRFINKNINVYVSLIDESFDSEAYFALEKKLYEPYINFERCLERTMIQIQRNPSYRVYFSSIVWKVSPYMSEENLYWNTSSPLLTFKFLDYDTNEKIYLSNCGEENNIELYFPVNNFDLFEKINEKKENLSPENQYDLNSDIFCDPVYINKSGAVFDTPLEERRQKYFLGFNFSCKYYKISSEDQNDIQLSKETLDYHKYLKENYIQCLTNKLMQNSYSEFVVDSFLIPYEFHLNSRFFFLKHYKLLSWKDNYKNNQAFYYFVMLSAIYAGLSLIYIYFEKYHYVNMQRLSELKKEITKLNLPYRDEYIFNNDLQMFDEIKGKLKDKRKPNMEEMNLDVNIIDINIMADEIAKYNKGFKKKENALSFNPEFFGIKPKENFTVNTKFFNDEENLTHKVFDNEEISQEKFEKMKKYYQVGFSGLDIKENTKKEMQLSKDRKKININKVYNLEKISEKDDEEPFDLEIPEKIFFNEEKESYKEEKSTTFKKRSKRKNQNNELDQYKTYVSTNDQFEHVDTESKLKSSKRETATKKFFNSNPPKKQNEFSVNSLVLAKKDQQKIAKSNSAFFGNINLNLSTNKPKKENKKENIFQKEYKNEQGYKPNFSKPKIISENLGFYNANNNDFEQEKDNDNINPPYFGKNLRKKIEIKKNDEINNAEMKVGFYYKNKQIELIDDEEKMPQLSENLTFEKKMEEFHEFSISFKKFLIKNMFSRHILLTTFDRMSIVYSRYMRAGNFFAQLSMFAFFLSLFFINDEKQEYFKTKNKIQFAKLILYCFISDILGCIVIHLPAYCFWVNDKKFRKLYCIIRNDGGMNALKQTEDIIKKGRFFWNILGIIIQILYIIIGFYFSFGFCATYSYQKSTFFFGLIITCLFDFIISEFIWEIFIGILFYIRDYGRIIVFFGTLLNTLRNIKHLI